MKAAANEESAHLSRRLEEMAFNGSGAPHSLIYDGWLLGYRPGTTKRLRSVNPFYASTLALQEKIEYCIAFYAAVRLPAIFRMFPFSQPRELDGVLECAGWQSFERTSVLRAALGDVPALPLPAVEVEIVESPAWEPLAAHLLKLDAETLASFIARASAHPLPQAGALVRQDGEVVACGLLKLEDRHAGLFAVHTAEAWRGRGFARAVVATLLTEARQRGAETAYLQVTAENAPALALYRRFGFAAAHDYWYRAREGEQR